jgi:hypothetical protein
MHFFQPCARDLALIYQNGHFATCPSLTVVNVHKYLPNSDAMAKGHMDHIRHHIRSMQPQVMEPTPESEMVQEDKCNFIFAAIMETSQIYTDLKGRFPTTSLSGSKYILIVYDYDSNIVLSAPIKTGVKRK